LAAVEVELIVVTMAFEATDATDERLRQLLARYVVLARDEPGCRNIDLVASATRPNRYLLIEKWDSAEAQRAHFDASPMVELAEACRGLLAHAPSIDLHDPISAHDLH
jgi:quinol monooxygenase YgiN